MANYYSYLLKCSDGSFYAGYTNDLKSREKKHNDGLGARYTRGRLPVKVVYFEEHLNRSEAMKRESEFKKMSRAKKSSLCNLV